MADVLYVLAGIAGVALLLSIPVVNWLKGKRWMALWGLLAVPVGFGVVPLITAIRVAKPRSWWDRKLYDDQPDKRRKQRERFYA